MNNKCSNKFKYARSALSGPQKYWHQTTAFAERTEEDPPNARSVIPFEEWPMTDVTKLSFEISGGARAWWGRENRGPTRKREFAKNSLTVEMRSISKSGVFSPSISSLLRIAHEAPRNHAPNPRKSHVTANDLGVHSKILLSGISGILRRAAPFLTR